MMAYLPLLVLPKPWVVFAAYIYGIFLKSSLIADRRLERRMRAFRLPERMQAFLPSFGPIRQHFAIKQHRLHALLYRQQLDALFAARRRLTEVTQNPSPSF
ncbi:hypothetical protein FAZ69_16715 [Trinickia terrae]|uniref:Uncharacterized protein n=1 Tax=Trinickia terrae TaxID=2571161 RepID=A0A4U1I3T3_9BURK|nr:hypothetical protein FAZ69_16715 [Trinickia terrae]